MSVAIPMKDIEDIKFSQTCKIVVISLYYGRTYYVHDLKYEEYKHLVERLAEALKQ